MWLDCSDGEQEGQEETARERGERCEVWKERVSGRVEVRSEENKEPGVMREKETGQEKTIDEKPPGLEDVENEPKTQEEEKQSRVESEQEAQEGERREKRVQEAREKEAKAQEEREGEVSAHKERVRDR